MTVVRASSGSTVADGIVSDEASLTPIVLKAMAATSDPRLREIVSALVRHAHAFVLETRLTEEEFEQGLAFITAVGQATGEKKNETVLLADILGISSLVSLINNRRADSATTSALLGPFWRKNAPRCDCGDNIARGETGGIPLAASGFVRDVHGKPIAGADVDVWQASPAGYYDNQDPSQPDMNLRGCFATDVYGRYYFHSVRPAGYPVPTDGPGGVLLRAQNRHPYRPAHLHFMVSAPGYKTLITQVFADDSEHLHSDVVFAVLESLVGRFAESVDEQGQRRATLEYDFVLESGEQKFPLPPIP